MNDPVLIGVATANPPLKVTQAEVWQAIRGGRSLSEKEFLFYQRFLKDPSIQTRHVGIEDLESIFTETPDQSIQRFEKYAADIGTKAVDACLQDAGVPVKDVDALFVTTCTGYLCPGLSSYVAERAGFRTGIEALDLVGLGCGAALPALRAASDYLRAHAGSKVMVLCVEICTAASAWEDDTDLILSNALFGDGAAACLLSNESAACGIRFQGFHSLLWPEFREQLRFKSRHSRLCNVIHKDVPLIAARAVRECMDALLALDAGVPQHYAMHPGGRRVLDEIEKVLDFRRGELDPTRKVLRDYGNMSSPSVLYVLKEIWEKGLSEGDTIALFAFGAGFSAFSALGQYNGPASEKESKEYDYAAIFR